MILFISLSYDSRQPNGQKIALFISQLLPASDERVLFKLNSFNFNFRYSISRHVRTGAEGNAGS